MKWTCPVCGYVFEGDAPPEECPSCKAPGSSFKAATETTANWAAEHVIGIAKDVDPRVIEGLRMNFNGECSEVGMYLAMSRAADRQGYPEVAEAYKRIAFEEADHASRFAELLGECVSAETKANLARPRGRRIRRHRRQGGVGETRQGTGLRRHPRHGPRDGP